MEIQQPQHPVPSPTHTNKFQLSAPEGIYGQLTTAAKNKNIYNWTANIRKDLDEKQILQLKRQRIDVMKNVRDLRAAIAELQRQEEEVLREVSCHIVIFGFTQQSQWCIILLYLLQLDLEKALVTAELSTEQNTLADMGDSLTSLQAKIHRMEAQRNANRVLQETQQNKLRQSIDMKQSQVDG